jgi:hypothetical protein
VSKWIDLGVFCGGTLALVAGVGFKDWAAALMVLGGVMMATVVMARIGARKA